MQKESSAEIKEGFKRQRRNLIFISTLLLFIETADVTFGSVIKPPGSPFDLSIKNPQVIWCWLWAAYAYLLWRYIVYMNDLRNRGFFDAYHDRMERYTPLIAYKKILQNLHAKGIHVVPEREPLGEHTYYRKRGFWQWEIGQSPIVKKRKEDEAGNREMFETVLSFRELLLPRIRSWAYVLTSNHHVSEYAFPLVIAASCVVVALYSEGNPSIFGACE